MPEIGNGSSVAVNIDGHVTNTNNPEMSQSMVENKEENFVADDA